MKKGIGEIVPIDIYTAFYMSSYASLGALFPLIGQYLAGIGFSGGQIGIVTASATAMGILANPFWGGIYHRHGRNKRLLLFLCVLTALLSLLLPAVRAFLFFLPLYVLVFFFENPIFPLLDSTTMEANYPFGQARKWGAIGYAAGIGIAGPLSDAWGLDKIFFLFSAFFLITACFLAFYVWQRRDFPSAIPVEPENSKVEKAKAENAKAENAKAENKGHFQRLIGNKPYIALLFSTFFVCGPSFAHNVYFSFLYIEGGGTIAGMGIAMLLMALSEAPFMAWTARVPKKIPLEKMILIAMCVSALRYLWYGTGPAPALLTATFFLQGFVNGVILVEVVKYIAKLVGDEMISLAIPLYTALSSNCGTIVCQLSGGVIVDHFGGSGVYLFYGLFNLIGIFVYIVAGLHKSAPPSYDPPVI